MDNSWALSPPTSEFVPLREAEMGEISDEDGSDFAPVEVDIHAMNDDGAEDLFFSSNSFVHSRDIGPDTSFGWDNAIVPAVTVNVMQSTPSPRSKFAPVSSKLGKKYRPRDSGIVLSEDESHSTGAHAAPDFVPPAPRHRYTLGRSESVNLSMPPASTSVSTLGSGSSEQELITPIIGPSTSSGWPLLTSSSSTASSLGVPDVSSIDAFILHTLMQAARRGEHAQPGGTDGGNGMRPPGTPQKRGKTAAIFSGPRLWQSAVASKIGFDFGNDGDEDDNEGDAKGQHDKAKAKRTKKAPRKSLPAAFPLRSKTSRGRGHAPGAGDSDEEFGQHDTSPTERKASYDGLGLGRPSVSKAGWLLRRSSSGAISSATSGSMSGDGSPSGTANAVHRMSRLPLLLHLVHEIDGRAHLMSNRLAAATATHSTQAFPTEVEHPEPPRVEPDRVKFVGVIDNNDSVLAQKVPARSATTDHLRKRAGSAARQRGA
jgi:mitosis inhibitor protein kinase SWE1